MNIIKKGILATTLAASAIVGAAAPAAARDGYRDYRGHDNTAAVAIGVGVLGLAVGAIAASNSGRHHNRHYDRRDYNDGYYDNDRRYYRNDRYDDRSADWNRRGGYDRGDRWGDDSRYYSRRGY